MPKRRAAMQKYNDLYSLIQSDPKADQSFRSLPGYAQGAISSKASGVNSYESLITYAEKLTRGDL
ncbi:hypothetical protein DWY99_02675 [[Clostridium] leptum]|uniref:Uncharacterized protein n=1 Tax=[Clostridium] leptum TaxID=1535 RepID=A0A412B022_9FIRM|nr:hypothetical protein DWY99_02675 [[Clostridium] leptum]